MARRRKGRALTGWLIVDKPAGLTSTAVVNKARYLLGAQKAGHCGTLDPAATGLLAIAFGEATKAVPYITDAAKAYRFTIAWGAATNTDDAEGEVIATSAARPSEADIRAALPAFIGDIEQVPPRFSAVRIDGRRAYALARAGEDPALAARPLWVESLDLVAMPDADTATFDMVCGKGGYVRAIARDLGAELGCFGHVASLRRLWSGPFSLAEHGLDWPEGGPAPETLEAALLPLDAGLADLPEARVDAPGAARLRHGNPAPVLYTEADTGDAAWASDGTGTPLALGTYKYGQFHPNRVFNLQT